MPLLAAEPRLLDAIGDMPREHVLSPLFPGYLVQKFSAWQTRRLLQEAIEEVRIFVTLAAAGGTFSVHISKRAGDDPGSGPVLWTLTSRGGAIARGKEDGL